MDLIEESAKILSAALEGASRARIAALQQHLKHNEIEWLLKMLVDRKLLEMDSTSSSAYYWTTVNGVKLLEIRFNMERMLQAQKSLV